MIQGEINRIIVLAKSGEVVPVPVIAPQRFYIDFNESTNPPVRAGACAVRLVLLRRVCALTGTCCLSIFLDRWRPDSPTVAGRRGRSAGNTLSGSGSSSGAENRRSFGRRCVSNSGCLSWISHNADGLLSTQPQRYPLPTELRHRHLLPLSLSQNSSGRSPCHPARTQHPQSKSRRPPPLVTKSSRNLLSPLHLRRWLPLHLRRPS